MTEEVFLPGQKVRILTQEEMPITVKFGWVSPMNQYSGNIMILAAVHEGGQVYFQNMPPSMARWSWSTDMIAHYESPEKNRELSRMWLEIMQ